MTDLDLAPEQWDALDEVRDTLGVAKHADALDAVLAHRPKPVLEDGKYLTPSGDLVFVQGSRYSHNAFDIGPDGTPLPADTSGWTRIRTLAEHETAVDLRGYFVAEDGRGDLAIWREYEGMEPDAVLYRYSSTASLFDALAAALPHRDDTEAGELR